jgi:hypothetical protein
VQDSLTLALALMFIPGAWWTICAHFLPILKLQHFCRPAICSNVEYFLTLHEDSGAEMAKSSERPFRHFPWMEREACLAAMRVERERTSPKKKMRWNPYVHDEARDAPDGEDSSKDTRNSFRR